MVLAVINAKSAWTASERVFDAVLVIGERIAFVGSTAEVMSRVDASHPDFKLIDLGYKFCLYPGFVDSHIHFMDGGRSLTALSLRNCSSKSEFISAIREFISTRRVPAGAWIRGGEWSEVRIGCEPDRSWIDEATVEHPVLLHRFDLHTALCNTTALELAGILREAVSPAGGVIEIGQNGQPSGILRDSAINLVKRLWPKADTEENNRRASFAAMDYLLSHGITSAFSMTSLSFSNADDTMFLIRLARDRELTVRLRNAVTFEDIPFLQSLFSNSRSFDEDTTASFCVEEPDRDRGSYLTLGAVKFFADGSLGSKTAAMKEPYIDDRCNCGLLCTTEEVLQSNLSETVSNGFQCCCHAIGDRALEIVVSAFERCAELSGEDKIRSLRVRVEHCQHVNDVLQLARMSALEIVASVQPCHLLFDGEYVERLLGLGRKKLSYLFRSMEQQAVRVVFGSDWMVAPADVVENMVAAVHRIPYGPTQSVWNEQERLSPRQALLAYTRDAAHSMFRDHDVGQIEIGFLADLTIWDADLSEFLTCGSDHRPQVLSVIVGGVVRFESTAKLSS